MRVINTMDTARGPITVIHDAAPADVAAHAIHPGLTSIVRNPAVRQTVLRDLAADPHARLTLAVADGMVIGHFAAGPSFGRWRALPHVREVAFEVARDWRHLGILSRLAAVAVADPAAEDEILVGFLWPSAWDLDYERLGPIAYRKVIVTFAERQGFRLTGTDEPEIAFQQGGGLVVRVGARVPAHAVTDFHRAQYMRDDRHRPAA